MGTKEHLAAETNGEHQPCLKDDHPYRTATRFRRDAGGKLLRDEKGLLVPLIPATDVATRGKSTPEERAGGRERARQKREAEEKAIGKMRRKFERRQAIGDPDCKPSEREDFPLLDVLRRERRHDLIEAALQYRQLVALCEAEPLKGQSYDKSSGLEVVYRNTLRDGVAEVDAAAAKGFKGTRVPGGEIEYRSEVKRSKKPYPQPAKRILPAAAAKDGDPVIGRTRSLHVEINEHTIADYIDKRPRLNRIRIALGGLLEPFEDAVLGGQTLSWIGEQEGYSGSTATAVGKGLVMRGLAIVHGFLGRPKIKSANDNFLIIRKKSA